MPLKLKKSTTAVKLLKSIVLAAVLVLPVVVKAQASLGVEFGSATGLGSQDVRLIVARVIQIALGLLGIIAVGLIVYGGYLWMTSKGNEEQVGKAKKLLVNACIGLAIILAAFSIATYIITKLGGSAFGGNNGQPIYQQPFNPNPYALGGGVLKDVYPTPNATNIPRNTLIMVNFREAMDATSIISSSGNPEQCTGAPQGTRCGYLQTAGGNPTTKIVNLSNNNQVLGQNEVVVMTNDNKNFVFKPVSPIGSSNGNSNYLVNLSADIKKANGSAAFSGVSFSVQGVSGIQFSGYTWRFEVSNILDVTPPQVVSIVPADQTVPKNATLQINFNEAVNVTSATGHEGSNSTAPDNTLAAIIITYKNAQNQNVRITGDATISNGFKTVEFSPDAQCLVNGQPAVNSCGLTPTCFPGSVQIISLIKAAPVDASHNTVPTQLLSGITDAAGNSLDGNKNGLAEGTPADDVSSTFTSSDDMDLTPPEIINPIIPEKDNQTTPVNQQIKATFNKYIRSSTLTSDNFKVYKAECGLDSDNFPTDPACYPAGGFSILKQDFNSVPQINGGHPATQAILKTYHPYLDPVVEYNSRLTSGIQDLYQNCFKPAVGP